VVAWSDFSGQGGDTSGAGIKAQLFDASGTKVGSETRVNSTILNNGRSRDHGPLDGRVRGHLDRL
jgi:hypothetical protein